MRYAIDSTRYAVDADGYNRGGPLTIHAEFLLLKEAIDYYRTKVIVDRSNEWIHDWFRHPQRAVSYVDPDGLTWTLSNRRGEFL